MACPLYRIIINCYRYFTFATAVAVTAVPLSLTPQSHNVIYKLYNDCRKLEQHGSRSSLLHVPLQPPASARAPECNQRRHRQQEELLVYQPLPPSLLHVPLQPPASARAPECNQRRHRQQEELLVYHPYHRLYSMYHYSHPPLQERLSAINAGTASKKSS